MTEGSIFSLEITAVGEFSVGELSVDVMSCRLNVRDVGKMSFGEMSFGEKFLYLIKKLKSFFRFLKMPELAKSHKMFINP